MKDVHDLKDLTIHDVHGGVRGFHQNSEGFVKRLISRMRSPYDTCHTVEYQLVQGLGSTNETSTREVVLEYHPPRAYISIYIDIYRYINICIHIYIYMYIYTSLERHAGPPGEFLHRELYR